MGKGPQRGKGRSRQLPSFLEASRMDTLKPDLQGVGVGGLASLQKPNEAHWEAGRGARHPHPGQARVLRDQSRLKRVGARGRMLCLQASLLISSLGTK